MIVTRLIGGLGNQMFQYAAGKALALKHGVDVKADLSELNRDAEGKYTQRHYELTIFSSNIKTAAESDLTPFLNKDKSKIKRELQRRFPFLFKTLTAVESGSSYHPEFEKYPENTYLQGFWQSELYFKEYEKEIRKAFQFNQTIIEACKSFSDMIQHSNSVSLHIRRGDYVNNPSANKFHGLCSPQYYENAVKHIAALQGQIEIIVFSDDIAWCKENLKFDFPIHFLETGSAYNDLYLMTQCRHNIIANSSFSWWGAWLNAHPDKIVVGPKQWFADMSVNTSDILPVSWIRL
ncbi:MAG: alpha-1,2-fucosyltransferase [Bacteroidota bacterium]